MTKLTKQEIDQIKKEADELTRIVNAYRNEPYTRFCVTIIDDKRKKYADVNIQDWDMQMHIMQILGERLIKLNVILQQHGL